MRDEYNIEELNPRKNPYVKSSISNTINTDSGEVENGIDTSPSKPDDYYGHF